MKALVLNEVKQPLVLQERPSPKAGTDKVIVKLRAAALNRRDYWITRGLYPGIRCPVILGSDGAGTAEFREKEVIINPVIDEVFALSDGNKALEKMKVSSQFGKLVLRVGDR